MTKFEKVMQNLQDSLDAASYDASDRKPVGMCVVRVDDLIALKRLCEAAIKLEDNACGIRHYGIFSALDELEECADD